MARQKTSDSSESTAPTRTAMAEVLAGHVRAAADASIRAIRAAKNDRQFISDLEWDQTDRDTLWDIDAVADTLHGFASWVLSGVPHPERPRVLKTLRELDHVTGFDLRAKMLKHSRRCRKLWAYIGRLQDLQRTLLAYFEEEERSFTTIRTETAPAVGPKRQQVHRRPTTRVGR